MESKNAKTNDWSHQPQAKINNKLNYLDEMHFYEQRMN